MKGDSAEEYEFSSTHTSGYKENIFIIVTLLWRAVQLICHLISASPQEKHFYFIIF
jgi:hypothetical protein